VDVPQVCGTDWLIAVRDRPQAKNLNTFSLENVMNFRVTFIRTAGIFCLMLFMPLVVSAQSVDVKDAWVRGTVPVQKTTGAFMEITGKSAVRLLRAESPVATSVEIHNMTLQNGVMKMFPVDGIDVPAGKTVKLAPGGYHMMFMGLKQQMKTGDRVPLKLIFERSDQQREILELSVEVRDIAGDRRHAH
jgi:copper(I)-binding protein